MAGIGGSALLGGRADAQRITAKKKPNVLILFSDQHAKNVMGFEGHPDVITPNLDKLAAQSLVFDKAYCTTGICVPSRSSLLTGLMPRTLGLLCNRGRTSVMEDAVSMASIFQRNGYKTFAFGKRHVSSAIDAGWDVRKDHFYKPDEDDNYVRWIVETFRPNCSATYSILLPSSRSAWIRPRSNEVRWT